MKYRNVSCTHRFLAFLIDNLIVLSVVNLILHFIPFYREQSKFFLDSYWKFLQDTTGSLTILQDLYKSMIATIGIHMLVALPLFFLYYVVLAYFWEKQTVGRLLVGVRVITYYDSQKPTFSRFLLREIIGGYLCLTVLGNGIIIYIVTWILSANSGRSLVDYIGGTRLVYAKGIPVNSEDEYGKSREDDEYIEAEFKETAPKDTEKIEEDYRVF